MKLTIEVEVKKHKDRVMHFAYNSAKFCEGDFKGEAIISGHSLLINLSNREQYQVDYVDILTGLKNVLEKQPQE